MGRYYNTQRFNGKFGFATQDSTDPEYFGMYESDNYIHYYIDDDKIEDIKEQLTQLFDSIDVPADKRQYCFEDDSSIAKYLDRTIYDYCFVEKKKEDIPKDSTTFYCDRNGYSAVEKKESAFLIKCRLALGLRIYNDLRLDGYCSLDAEC